VLDGSSGRALKHTSKAEQAARARLFGILKGSPIKTSHSQTAAVDEAQIYNVEQEAFRNAGTRHTSARHPCKGSEAVPLELKSPMTIDGGTRKAFYKASSDIKIFAESSL
jgi:hypothetical protein